MDLDRDTLLRPPLSATVRRLAGHALWFGLVFGCGFLCGRIV